MAKARSKSAIVKAFEQSSSPIYLIDDQHRLAYGNDAFFDWVGVEDGPQRLIGTRLVYSSSHDLSPEQALICGLTPPPTMVQHGGAFWATVSIAGGSEANESESPNGDLNCDLNGDPSQRDRQARADFVFIRLSSQKMLLAVVAMGRSPDRNDLNDQKSGADFRSVVDGSANLHQVLQRLAESLGPWQRSTALVGHSQYVLRLQKQVKAAAQHGLEFTIAGPDGTGREGLARTIMAQRQSPGINPPQENDLVVVHGYVADIELIRSSVAQAIQLAKQNAIDSSNRTDKVQPWLLILDADQLDAASQAELWATLHQPSSRLKVIATAQRDLMRCIDDDGYHGGLAHLLTTQTIHTAALGDHLSDLPMIIAHEIERINVHRSRSLSGFSVAAMQLLMAYHWPGNQTELTSVVEAAADSCDSRDGVEIDVADLPEKFRFAIAALKHPPTEVIEINLESYLGEIELKLVQRALKMTKGNKTKAAKLLGVSRAKLLRRIQHFNLQELEVAPESRVDRPSVGSDLSADDFRPLDEPLFEEADD